MHNPVKAALSAWGLELTQENLRKLELFAAGLKEKNALLNLVSKTDEPRLWERHILDALAGAPLLRRLLKPGAAIADAGSGAGFPGLVLSAVLEEFRFSLLDSSRKRCSFLNWSATVMNLKNVSVSHRRIGEGGAAAATGYDAVIERAMGQLENILPQCLNILAEGGVFLAWQSAAQTGERPAVNAVMLKAGGELSGTFSYKLPDETEDRHILVFRKRLQR